MGKYWSHRPSNRVYGLDAQYCQADHVLAMTNTRMEEITRAARQAAMAARSGWPVKGAPQSYTAEEAKLWTERFERAMKGVE